VHNIIDLHRGSVDVERGERGGSVFTILLPLAGEHPVAEGHDPQPGASKGRPAKTVKSGRAEERKSGSEREPR